jgi:potassium efflux system protein
MIRLLPAVLVLFAGVQDPEQGRAALDEARAELEAVKDASEGEEKEWRDAYQERVDVLEAMLRTRVARAALPQADDVPARTAALGDELRALERERPPDSVTLESTDELAAYEQAATAASAARVNAQSAVDSLATRISEAESELAGLPDRSSRAQARTESVEGADDIARYRVSTAHIETRQIAERATFLTEAIAAWRAQGPVLDAELRVASLRAERAAAAAALATEEASRLRELEAQQARDEAEAEARRAARQRDPIERFRGLIRAEAGNLRAETKGFETALGKLKARGTREHEAVNDVSEERTALDQRLRLRPRGVEVLLKQHLERNRRARRLITDVTIPELDDAYEANQALNAAALDRIWALKLPEEEHGALAELLGELDESRHEEARAAFEVSMREDGLLEALEQRTDQLQEAAETYEAMTRNVNERSRLLAEYEEYILGRMLWTRSDPAIDVRALSTAWEEIKSISAPYEEVDAWTHLRRNAVDRFPVSALVAGLITALFFLRRRFARWADVGAGQKPVPRAATRAAAGLLWAFTPPLQLWLLAWGLRAVSGIDAFDPAFARFLEYQALFVLARRVTKLVLGPRGLAIGSHAVAPEVGMQIVRSVSLVTIGGQIFYAPYRVFTGAPFQFEVFPRLFYTVWALLGAVAVISLVRPSGPFVRSWTVEGGLLRSILRFLMVWSAVALGPLLVLDILGFRVGVERSLLNALKVLASIFALGLLFRVLERLGTWLVERSTPAASEDEERVRAARLAATRAIVRVGSTVVVVVGAFVLKEMWDIGGPIMKLAKGYKLVQLSADPEGWLTLWEVILAVLCLAIGHIFASNLRRLHESLVAPFQGVSDEGSRYAFLAILRYATLGVTYAVALLTLGFSFETLGWFATAASVGLGFGLQEIVANFISGLILLFERPIRVGDIVTIGSTSGTVDNISMRATVITNWERQTIIVPNKKFVTENLTNWTRNDKIMRRELVVRVAYGTNIEQAIRLIDDIVKAHPDVLEDPPHRIWFQTFGVVGIELKVWFFTSIEDGLAARSTIHAAINDRFADAGIEIPVVKQLEQAPSAG